MTKAKKAKPADLEPGPAVACPYCSEEEACEFHALTRPEDWFNLLAEKLKQKDGTGLEYYFGALLSAYCMMPRNLLEEINAQDASQMAERILAQVESEEPLTPFDLRALAGLCLATALTLEVQDLLETKAG